MSSTENEKLRQEPSETVECENDNKPNSKPEANHAKSLPNQPSMRTRHRPRNKSVLQSAIARKERSLRVDDQPKQRPRRIKPKPLELGEIVGEPLAKSSLKNSPLKRVKRSSPRMAVKKKVLAEFSDEGNNESSPDTHTSDNKNTTRCKEQLVLHLCKCTEDKQLYMESKSDSQFCTAIDGMTDQLIGCTRLVDVTTVPMFRPSNRVPFGVFCKVHRNRLIRHNCCPTCGVFCTQGAFSECPSKHHFHKDCKLSIGQEDFCPHCGDPSPSTDIIITMHTPKPPVFLPVQVPYHATPIITADSILESSLDSTIEQLPLSPPVIPSDQLEKLQRNVHLDQCNRMDLADAIQSCDAEKVTAILKLGNVDLNVTLETHNNGNFLHLAALKANTTILYLLVTGQVPLDLLDDDQHTPLMIAILEHKNDMVKYLVQAGADLTLKGIDGMTSLHVAAKSGNLEACKILLNSNFTIPNFVNIQDDGGWTPLVWACEHGYCEIIKYLVSMKADITIRDVEHNAPLHWAAFKGSTEVVELLLNLESDVNVLNVHGDTPLHISSREDHYNCVLVLISRGADLSVINKNNETPLDCASKSGMCFNPLMLNAQLQLAFTDGKRKRVSGLLVNDISKGRELNPIQCYNNIDSDEEPTDYKYIKKNCITLDNIYVKTKIDTTECCNCNDRCRSNDCLCVKLSQQTHYNEEKLPSDFNFEDPPTIFECNDLCSCNAILCSNRLVQKPLTHRFQLFKTVSKGWAIKALHVIPTGSFVCEYIGEILTDSEAELREDDSYLFDLDHKEFDSFCIDAKLYGNFSRFINHSCHPNLHPVKVFIDHHDLRFPRIAFFAKRDILPNEELSFDYGDKFWSIKSFSCVCGAECCKYSGKSVGEALEKDASQS